MFGGVVYGITTFTSGRDFSWTDLGVSVGVGAAGGALIETGVGAATGIAMLTAVGAGTGILGSQLGYETTAGKDYSSVQLLTTSAIGGSTGAITGALGQPGLNPVVAIGGKIAVQGVSGVADYSLQSALTGKQITWNGTKSSFAVGVGSGIINEVIPSFGRLGGSRVQRIYEDQWEKDFIEAYLTPSNPVRNVMKSRLVRTQIWNSVGDDIIRSAGINIIVGPLKNIAIAN